MQWWVEYTLDTLNYKEDLRNTKKAFYVHGSTKLNIKIVIVSCTTKWLIFQNSVTNGGVWYSLNQYCQLFSLLPLVLSYLSV